MKNEKSQTQEKEPEPLPILPVLPVRSGPIYGGFEHPFGDGISSYRSKLSQLSQWIKKPSLDVRGNLY